MDSQQQWGSGAQAYPGLKIGHTLELVQQGTIVLYHADTCTQEQQAPANKQFGGWSANINNRLFLVNVNFNTHESWQVKMVSIQADNSTVWHLPKMRHSDKKHDTNNYHNTTS